MSRHPAVRTSRIKWTQLGTWIVAAFTLAAVVYLVQARNADHHHQARLENTVSALSTGMAQNQAQLQKLGERPVGPPAKSVAAGKATPPPTEIAPVTPGPTTPISVGPTAGQVRTAVNAYFADNPVKPPRITADQLAPLVTKYVTQYLREHPPAAGPAGQPGATGSPGKPGAAGEAGQPGSTGPSGAPASNTQIAAAVTTYLPGAVAAYLTENPPPAGPAGPSGAPGANCDPETTPACIGPSGPAGPPGSPGKDATPEEIATAVADYIDSNGIPCPGGTHQGDVPVPGPDPLSPGPTIRGCIID